MMCSPLNSYAYGFRHTGTIPEELGKLTALEELDLSYNDLSGEETTTVRFGS